ncbi:MAG: hypothetical protein IIC52_01405 [Proteobacteria bacterium]|nr:hypothetical protein [Pseudomonadota bacterium]
MPVRRRVSKARPNELEAWRVFFTMGHDFFQDLEPLGITSETEAQAAAPDAWGHLGYEFMRRWRPTVNTKIPWALEEFGEP